MELDFLLNFPWKEILTIGFTICLILTVSLYWYLTWHFGYWEKQGVDGDKPHLLMGTMQLPWKVRPEEQDKLNYLKYGRIYGVYEGRYPCLHVAQPELLHYLFVEDATTFPNRRLLELSDDDVIAKKLLTNMRGKQWRQMRACIMPSFDDDTKLQEVFSLVSECAEQMIHHLMFYVNISEPFEARKSFSAFTLDVIARCAFGKKLDCIDTPTDAFITHAKKLFKNPPIQFFLMYYAPSLLKFFSPIFHEKSFNYFIQLVQETIEKRRKNPTQVHNDFLQFLIESQTAANEENNDHTATFDLVTFQAVLFLFAGHETTATAIALAAYSLAMNPEIQEKLIKEIDKTKGELDYESINQISYLDKVINETLRLYPPVVRTERTCANDYTLGGIQLRQGMVVSVPIYSMHHDPEFYPDPETFDPERFSEQQRSMRDPFTYLPFGYGERSCLGLKFALMMIKTSLIYVLKRFRIVVCFKTEIPLEFNFGGLLLQPKSITLGLESRQEEIRIP